MILAVSACLLGEPCRYDGAARPCPAVIDLGRRHQLVPVCPERAGGLPVPRPPSEVTGRDPLRVSDARGADVTAAFEEGARRTLEEALGAGCEVAVLKAKSPSCGSGLIYDGSFSGTLAPGWGVAAALLRDAGLRVLDEDADLSTL
ncbi:MAG: DUF523 domain-containing protein [Eggerthellaceae bacterium]|nr:DUF523 domain-containing protein [Eggerthellaceae bacterium]